LILALERQRPKKFIFISSTSVYGDRAGEGVDETTPVDMDRLSPDVRCLLNAEHEVLKSSIPSIVFRLGGIYGYGRNRLKRIQKGAFVPAFSGVYTNRIHLDDIVEGIQVLMEKGKAGEIYLGVDDEPVTQDVFYSWIYEKLSLVKPDADILKTAPPRGSKRCSNQKIKALGLQFKYPSFRQGYRELIKEVLSGER